ncbi:MAG: biotin--[Clostridia bacterium]|nr:biotin--[acetyl-CoA-carboxylase] ligase [Clostridia bacterium]
MNNTKAVLESKANVCGKNITVLSSVDSTNNYVKEHADILPDGHIVVANEQLSGRGRQGKKFYSPSGEGLYMSILVKDTKLIDDELFTAKICLAVCRAIDRLTGTDNNSGVGIKWVNDIYFGKKKLCGILCERFRSPYDKTYVVAGVGVNVSLLGSTIPKDLRSIVTSLYDITKKVYDRFELASLICEEFEKVFSLENTEVLREYKRRSIVIGREIRIVREEGDIRAAALDICEDGALLVRTEEGYTQKLCGGEITIRLKK